MTDFPTITDADLCAQVDQILAADPSTDEEAEEGRGILASWHEELSPAQRHTVAAHMQQTLKKSLKLERLDARGVNILSLADPYFTRSDLQTAVRMLLSAAFDPRYWSSTPFEDLVSIGNALADLAFAAPGARERWEDFYAHFQKDDERRADALDVALAGLSSISVEAFAGLANRVPFDDQVLDRWTIYLPTLLRVNAKASVQLALSEFVAGVPERRTQRLRENAKARGLSVEAPKPFLVSNHDPEPAELKFALGMLALGQQLPTRAAVSDTKLRALISDYAAADVITEYQTDVVRAVHELDPGQNVRVDESRAFSELPSDGTLRHRYLYVFPMYLTENKRRHGYSVFAFGRHRRLGAVFARNSLLTPPEDDRTLRRVLRDVHRMQTGRVYSLLNFAMQEMAVQTASEDPQLATDFDYAKLRSVNATAAPARAYVPAEVGKDYPRATVFIFDLAGLKDVKTQINRAQAKGFLKGAQIMELEHDLDIPVGIGVNLYGCDWAHQNNRWIRLRELAAKWADNQDFRESMKELGVDIPADDGAQALPVAADRSAA